MSTVEVRPEGENSTVERTISRAVAEFSAGNGRTIDVRIVPYGVTTEVSDGGPAYREMWLPGAFSDQVRGAEAGRARQVFVNFEHGNRLSDVIGHGLTLREGADGFYGSFELHDTADGEKARYMVEHGLLDGVSLEAFPKKTRRSKDGVVQRVKAHLVNIALCRRPAYAGASVLALREEEFVEDAIPVPPSIPDEVRERCHRLGIALPDEQEELIERAFTERPWDGNSSRWDTAEEYCSAAVIDLNPSGKPKTKQMCHLPIREPGTREVNVNAIRNALSRLGAGFPKDASASQRASATATLEKMLAQANAGKQAAARQAPETMMGEGFGGEASDNDAAQVSALGEIVSLARRWAANEDDPEDTSAMNRIIQELEALGQAETTETD